MKPQVPAAQIDAHQHTEGLRQPTVPHYDANAQATGTLNAGTTVLPTATLTEVSQFALNSSILAGTFEDVRLLAFSRRFPSGRVGALRPLYANTALVRRALTDADVLLAHANVNMDDVGDEELHRISDSSWNVGTSDYPEDSDLEDGEEYDEQSEMERKPGHGEVVDVAPDSGAEKDGLESTRSATHDDSHGTEHKAEDFVSVEVSEKEGSSSPKVFSGSSTEEETDTVSSVTDTSEGHSNGEGVHPRQARSPRQGRHTILTLDIAFRTLRTFVFHAYTGRVAFAPLRSQGFLYKDDGGDPSQFPVCSPKSMYRLAVKYGNEELRVQARTDIQFKLSTHNLLEELFSMFTASYTEIQELQLDLLVAYIKHPDITVRLPLWVDRFARGELRDCADTFGMLVQKLACAAVAPKALGSGPTPPTSCPKGCPMPTIQTHFRCSTCGFFQIMT